MGDIESFPCVSVLSNRHVKIKYNIFVSVIQNGWVELSLFHVFVFYKMDRPSLISTPAKLVYL